MSPERTPGGVDLSVVVSTCNRAADLQRMLQALACSRVPADVAWEVVVADNASTDDTPAVLAQWADRPGLRLIAVHEPRRGKAHGLHSALALARGQILAFTDDDILVAEDWVARIVEHFRQQPAAQCIGGRIELHNPQDAPVGIKTSRQPKVVTLHDFSPDCIPVAGCNMALRASLLRQVGPFDTDISPGSRIGVAEDLDILYRVVRAGAAIEYLPELLVHHNHGRRTDEQLRTIYRGYYAGRGAFYVKHALLGDRTAVRWAYWELRRLLRPWPDSQRLGLYRQSRAHTVIEMLRGAWRYLRLGERDKASA